MFENLNNAAVLHNAFDSANFELWNLMETVSKPCILIGSFSHYITIPIMQFKYEGFWRPMTGTAIATWWIIG